MEEPRKQDEAYRARLLQKMTDHIGQGNAVGMAELYEAVVGEPWDNRINDTRRIRRIITALRREGVAICSSSSQDGGGYYLASAGSELDDYLRRNARRALQILSRNAQIKKVSLSRYLGQLQLHMDEGAGHGEGA